MFILALTSVMPQVLIRVYSPVEFAVQFQYFYIRISYGLISTDGFSTFAGRTCLLGCDSGLINDCQCHFASEGSSFRISSLSAGVGRFRVAASNSVRAFGCWPRTISARAKWIR